MKAQLDNMHVDDLPYVERDLSLAQKVSLGFLLFGDHHVQATYLLQKLLALMRAPQPEQLNSDLLRQYAQTNPDGWRGHLIEALCIIGARQVLRKLGFQWEELRLHYLPHVAELTLHVHPLLKALYNICEQLTVVQSGRLVLDINDKLARRRKPDQPDEPLRFYDFAYLEIFLLDWLTRHHIRLGDINAVGSDVELLIEYFKFNDLNYLASLLIQTVNSSANVFSSSNESVPNVPSRKANANRTDSSSSVEADDLLVSSPAPPAVAAQNPLPSVSAYRVNKDRAGILLIFNQQSFHQNVPEELKSLLPKRKLAPRRGTDADRDRLTEVFSALGYQVEAYNNVDHLDILTHIRGACARSVVKDSLIVCILSHGFEGAIYGANSIALSITDIKDIICSNENLHDKPKILVIQACQQIEQQETYNNNGPTQLTATQQANLVLTMSTVPGFAAMRHSVLGSWFIQTLCDQVEQLAASHHFLDILTIAFREVGKKRGDNHETMVPIVMTTLQQNVYLSSSSSSST